MTLKLVFYFPVTQSRGVGPGSTDLLFSHSQPSLNPLQFAQASTGLLQLGTFISPHGPHFTQPIRKSLENVNHIVWAEKAAGASFVVADRPTGDRLSSPSTTMK